jgi:predicted DNA-binding protein with PD1-like motif
MTRSLRSIGSACLFLTACGLLAPLPAQQSSQASASKDEFIRPGAEVPRGLAPGMKVVQLGKSPRVFEVTFAKGDEIMSGMTEFAEKYHLKTSPVTGVGAFSSATLAWTDQEKRLFKKIPLDSGAEFTFTGDITVRNGKPNFHAHVMCALGDGTVKGGHLIDGHIGLIAEVFVTEPTVGDEAEAKAGQ